MTLKHWFDSLATPRLDWIQVEVTSCCNAACLYCPRTVWQDIWRNRSLTPDIYTRLLPVLPRVGMVYLQGWGEPFLHPDLMKMAQIAKSAGCRVGTTTNGMLLSGETLQRIVECGIDVLALSLAGVDAQNDAIRQGTRLEVVTDVLRELRDIKLRRGSHVPAVHIAYLLLRSRLSDIERLPLLLQGLGVQQVVVSTLDFLPSAELEKEAVVPASLKEHRDLCRRLNAVGEALARSGTGLHFWLRRPGERFPTCTENVGRSLFISADGEVSPCVFTNFPTSCDGLEHRRRKERVRRLTFGNITTASIGEIWRRKAYREFRNAFSTGSLPDVCNGCPKLFIG